MQHTTTHHTTPLRDSHLRVHDQLHFLPSASLSSFLPTFFFHSPYHSSSTHLNFTDLPFFSSHFFQEVTVDDPEGGKDHEEEDEASEIALTQKVRIIL